MDKKKKNENDEISQLLDSFQTNEEDTLEQKMDQFTKKQTRSRVEKHKPEPEIPFQAKKVESSLGDTFVVGSKDLNEPKEDLSATRTVMWNADDLKQEADSTNQTVVIDDDEIQSLLEEGKGPQLKREVINKKKEPSQKKSAPKKSHSKTGMYVALGVVGVLLVSLLIFGGMKLMTGGLSGSDEKTSEVQKKNYQELLDFANNYDSLSSSDQKEIVNLESKYNSLTRKQREKIDEILEKATGKNFNELLASANKKTSTKKDNNNTEIAEKKAQLKQKINDLKKQLLSAQSELENAQKAQSDAQSDVDSLQAQIDSAGSGVSDAQTAYLDATDAFNLAQNNLAECLKIIDTYGEIPNDQITPEQNAQLTEAQKQKASLQSAYDAAAVEYANKKSAYEEAKKNSDTSSLENKLKSAKTKLDNVNSDVTDAQSKVDSLNSQITDYQNQLNQLD